MYTDKTLTCRDCDQAFIFSTGEQELFAGRGFDNVPGRCPECRAARNKHRDETAPAGGYSAGGYSGGSYARVERQMFPAVCSTCGKQTQVPFQPRADRPVYCSDCFATQRGAAPAGMSRNRY